MTKLDNLYKVALKNQDYKACLRIQKEIRATENIKIKKAKKKAKKETVKTEPDLARRERCLKSLHDFLTVYQSHRFYSPAEIHQNIVEAFQESILFTGKTPIKNAIAAPRSIGKTTIEEGAAIWAALYRHRGFIVIIGETTPKGQQRLASIKDEILKNELIHTDFQEIVNPIRAFRGDPRSSPPGYPWNTDRFRLANGVWCHGRGIDSSMAGLNELGQRPDLIIGDDVESVSSVRSATETGMIEERWRKEVCRLHDINSPAAYFWICTIRAQGSISAKLTDKNVEPEWRGRRYGALVKEPDRRDLWDKFMDCCRPNSFDGELELAEPAETWNILKSNEMDFSKLTEGHQRALRFYARNRDTMDAGAEVLDPIRLPLHVLFHARSTEGEDVFQCELQNNPSKNPNVTDRQIELEYLMKRRIDLRARIVPAWASRVICSVDVGMYRCHWEASAWSLDGTTSVMIECGIQETNVDAGGALKMTDALTARQLMVQEGINYALRTMRLKFAQGWIGSVRTFVPELIGIDCGGTAEDLAWQETILRHCVASGPKWVPLKGEKWTASIAERALGRNWICESERNPGRRIDCNADEYKLRLIRAYETPAADEKGQPFRGARLLNYDTPQEYCVHQTAERYVATFSESRETNKAERAGWFVVPALRRRNHWLDTAWMQFALADIFGVVSRRVQVRRSRPENQNQGNADPSMG